MSQSAARQAGVLSREQLHTLGLTNAQIRGRERNGELHQLYTDVWAVGRRDVTPKGHFIAALLACGPTSFLSHRTAAALHGLRAINVKAIEVTMVAERKYVRRGLEVHRTAKPPAPEDLRTVTPLRYTSVPRLLIELAPRETPAELNRLITEAVRRRRLDLKAMEAALQRHARRPGLARLNGRPYHVAAEDMERDRVKDTKLQAKQIKAMRVTGDRWDLDRAGVHSDLLDLLQLS